MDNRLTRTDKQKKSKWKRIIILSISILCILTISWAGSSYYAFQKAMKKMNEADQLGNNPILITDKKPHLEPFSVLLLGIDERPNDVGRTDTMIVATVNPDLGTVKLLSIPRDSRVEIVGNNTTEKINHAYARGGLPMSIDTVENLLSIPIDYYVAINMEGFLDIIDVLNGIEVENDMELAHRTYKFPEGKITLNGEEALVFSRIRKEDPRNDFGRQIRQKQIIEAIANKATNPKVLLQLSDIFEVLGDNVKTNFARSQLMDLQKLYSKLDGDIVQIQFKNGEDRKLEDGYWYYILNEEEVDTITVELQQHLDEEVNNLGTTTLKNKQD